MRIIVVGLVLLCSVVVLGKEYSCPDDPAEISLTGYNIDSDTIMVSGLSAGGFMATQYHFSYSSEVAGAALIASGPYWCANANAYTAQKGMLNKQAM